MHGVETVTFDTTVDPDGQVVHLARAMGLNLAVVSVTNREAEGSSFEVTLKSLDAIPETGVWDESRWDDSVGGEAEVDGKRLEQILAIITSGSFPTEREGLTKNQQHQLRDAMIFETHVRKSRDLFVTDDKKAFVNHGRRQLFEREFQTRILTSAEFIAQAACRDAPGDAAVDWQRR